ncbi:MAG: hypothetical protein ACXVBQ_06230 [Pseudobdellovibrionaceae bacterium]
MKIGFLPLYSPHKVELKLREYNSVKRTIMRKVILIISLLTSQLAFASNSNIDKCKEDIVPTGYRNSSKIQKVMVCNSDNSSAYYNKLCFGVYDYEGERYYNALQYSRNEIGSWLTTAAQKDGKSTIGDVREISEEKISYSTESGTIMTREAITEVLVNLKLNKIKVNTYDNGFLSNRLLGSDTYSCITE